AWEAEYAAAQARWEAHKAQVAAARDAELHSNDVPSGASSFGGSSDDSGVGPLADDGALLGEAAELGDGVTAADGIETATWSFEPAEVPPPHRTGPRVGVSGPGGDASAYPWRFWIPGEPSVSAYRPAVQRRR
ncbi:hypothetical protein NWP09_05940, partial [Agrococcus sp. HG114]|nr:hypothetical protein [Agrococcus sp. HG114]